MTVLLLIGGLAAIFVGLLTALAAMGVMGSERSEVQRTLRVAEASGPLPPVLRQEIDQPFAERVLVPTSGFLANLARRFTPADWANRVRRRLDLAGNPQGWDSERVLAAKGAAGLLGGGMTALIGLLLGWGAWGLLGAVALAIAGFFGPDLWLLDAAQRRTEAIRKALPDSMDLMSISVESGLAFDAALSQVAAKTDGPLADEFQRTLQEIQLGSSRSQAMKALADRTQVDDLNFFVSAVVQAESFGIPIAEVLHVQADEMRVRRSQRIEETAAKLPVKIMIPLIFTVLPATFIVILGPAAMRIAELMSH